MESTDTQTTKPDEKMAYWLALALALALAIARNAEHAADLSGGPKRHNHITSFAPCLMFA
jgi:hypothetical protein